MRRPQSLIFLKPAEWYAIAEKCQFDLDAMAIYCRLSRRQFERRFRDVFDQSPGEWLHDQRMALAWRLVADNEKTLKDISNLTGYNQLSNFCQAFKLHFKVTPNQLREHCDRNAGIASTLEFCPNPRLPDLSLFYQRCRRIIMRLRSASLGMTTQSQRN